MKSKYELTISTDYVPDWGVVEAVRELFQNALDNEAVDETNKMTFEYEEGTLRIANKHSKLTLDTLLLGTSSKRDDNRTIGQHGEGYKIAFVVLLRSGKRVSVLNYAANEVWETKIVKSRRYNGASVVQVEVDKDPFWKKRPTDDLTILVEGVTPEDWEDILKSNLILRKRFGLLKNVVETEYGSLLLDESEKGHVYLKGLYVCDKDLEYGYDISRALKLDRDRNSLGDSDVGLETTRIWTAVVEKRPDLLDTCTKMIVKNARDVGYLSWIAACNAGGYKEIKAKLRKDFLAEHGEKAYPVSNDSEAYKAKRAGYKPTIVPSELAGLLRDFDEYLEVDAVEIETVGSIADKLDQFKEKLDNEELESELAEIIEALRALE